MIWYIHVICIHISVFFSTWNLKLRTRLWKLKDVCRVRRPIWSQTLGCWVGCGWCKAGGICRRPHRFTRMDRQGQRGNDLIAWGRNAGKCFSWDLTCPGLSSMHVYAIFICLYFLHLFADDSNTCLQNSRVQFGPHGFCPNSGFLFLSGSWWHFSQMSSDIPWYGFCWDLPGTPTSPPWISSDIEILSWEEIVLKEWTDPLWSSCNNAY